MNWGLAHITKEAEKPDDFYTLKKKKSELREFRETNSCYIVPPHYGFLNKLSIECEIAKKWLCVRLGYRGLDI